jgi:hypothetical protein
MLEYQRQNMWIGRLQEARAVDSDHVYLRVFWLYWPHELPYRQSYHGRRELILSNHAEVVDVQTISYEAEVSYWNESDDQDESPLKPFFWRQTYDVAKGKAGMSKLRKHCVCRKEYNPDHRMLKCSRAECGIWNHEECLERSIRKRLEALLDKGTLLKTLDREAANFAEQERQASDTIGETISTKVEAIASAVVHALPISRTTLMTPPLQEETDVLIKTESPQKKGRGRPPKHKENVAERISVDIQLQLEGSGGENTVAVKVKLLPTQGKDVMEWTVQAHCLKCATALA